MEDLMTITELASSLNASESDVRALVDQLISLDGHDAVYTAGHVTNEAAAVIRDQIEN